MTLWALLSAQLAVAETTDDGSGTLAALLPVAGLTVIEQQALTARAAGVDRLLVLVDAMPGDLVAAFDRIRAAGLMVDVVRSAADVMAAIAGAAPAPQRLLLVADGLIAPAATWSALAAAAPATLLAVADAPATLALERLDPINRWAGLALLAASDAAQLDSLPEDWDPQLALLRTAAQSGARIMRCEPQLFELGDLSLIDGHAAATLVEMRMLAVGGDDGAGLARTHVLMPAARAAARFLLRAQGSGRIARGMAGMTAAAAPLLMMAGFPLAAIVAALLAAAANAAADVIASFRPEGRWWPRLADVATALSLAGLVAAGWQLGKAPAAGTLWPIALAGAAVLAERLSALLARKDAADGGWVADPALLWTIMLIGALAGQLALALAVLPLLTLALALVAVSRMPTR